MDDPKTCGACGKLLPEDLSSWYHCETCDGVFCSLDCFYDDQYNHDAEDDEQSAGGVES